MICHLKDPTGIETHKYRTLLQQVDVALEEITSGLRTPRFFTSGQAGTQSTGPGIILYVYSIARR